MPDAAHWKSVAEAACGHMCRAALDRLGLATVHGMSKFGTRTYCPKAEQGRAFRFEFVCFNHRNPFKVCASNIARACPQCRRPMQILSRKFAAHRAADTAHSGKVTAQVPAGFNALLCLVAALEHADLQARRSGLRRPDDRLHRGVGPCGREACASVLRDCDVGRSRARKEDRGGPLHDSWSVPSRQRVRRRQCDREHLSRLTDARAAGTRVVAGSYCVRRMPHGLRPAAGAAR